MEIFSVRILENCDWTLLLPAVVICLTTYIFIRWTRRIPGPIGLPYLGYYPFLSDEKLHEQLTEMTKKYGDVYCFTITGQTYAHLGSFKAMREAFVTKGNCFMRKSPNYNLFKDLLEGGVVYVEGENWKVLRRFFSQKLKDYGMGKETHEAWLVEALQNTVDVLKKSGGKDFNATEFFTDTCSFSIRHLVFRGTEVNDQDLQLLVEGFANAIATVSGTRVLLAGPLLKYVLMPFVPTLRVYKKAKQQIDSILRKIFRQREKDFDKENIRDLVDCFLNEKRILEESGDPKSKIYTEKAFIDTVLQVIGDGTLTIGMLVALILKVLAEKPEIQKRIQSEVDEIVGRERFPSWGLKNRMPYTVGVTYEVLRTSHFLPVFPSLECTEPTTVSGCPIPKGAILLYNFYSALMDPRVYEKPEVFDPARFLPTEDKKTKQEVPSLFGMGKRSCIGEMLVNMETFLFLSTVMQNFDILPATSQKQEDRPEIYSWIRAVPRKS